LTAQELHDKLVKRGCRLHGNRVAVAREKTVTQTRGGLYIPDTAQRENQYAAIVLVGDGPEVQKLGLEPGMRIYIQKYGGVDIKQSVAEEYYWLEAIHELDVYITYPDDGVELQQTDANSQQPEWKSDSPVDGG
jgi:co-chaperonin GroES (HSP10)